MKPLIQAILLLSVFLVSSCGIPDSRIKRKVAESEIIGTWMLDSNSSALAEDHDGDHYAIDSSKPHTIVFNADGTCHYRSVLQMPTRYVDASGTWSIAPPSDLPDGSEITIKLKIDHGGSHTSILNLKEDSKELIIWGFWSDPDLWNFLEYKRQDS